MVLSPSARAQRRRWALAAVVLMVLLGLYAAERLGGLGAVSVTLPDRDTPRPLPPAAPRSARIPPPRSATPLPTVKPTEQPPARLSLRAAASAVCTAGPTDFNSTVFDLLAALTARRAAVLEQPTTGAFVALVRHTADGLKRLVRLLRNVEATHPTMAARYPFIAFLEPTAAGPAVLASLTAMAGGEDTPGLSAAEAEGATPEELASIVGVWRPPGGGFARSGVRLALLPPTDFAIPPFVSRSTWPYPQHSYWGVPYRHMCRFFAFRIFEHPALQRAAFYLRLDTDSFLLAPAMTTNPAVLSKKPRGAAVLGELPSGDLLMETAQPRDWFQEAAARNATYGFTMLHPQTLPQFLDGLFSAVDSFLRAPSSPATSPRAAEYRSNGGSPFDAGRHVALHYWDNFEVVALRPFRSGPAASFLQHMDRAGGVYYHRWGDAELRTLTVDLFAAPDAIFEAALPYQHYHNYRCPHPDPAAASAAPTAKLLSATGRGGTKAVAAVRRALCEADSVAAAVLRGAASRGTEEFLLDLLMEYFSPLRRQLRGTAAAACVKARDGNAGGKGRGEAAMQPAEHATNKDAYASHVARRGGFYPVM